MLSHGGDVAVVQVKGGGRILLSQGDHAPFLPGTARALINADLAEYVEVNGKKSRFRLTEAGLAHRKSRGNPNGAKIQHDDLMRHLGADEEFTP